MHKNRVYIEDSKEAPDDATVREGKRGRLYYRTDERGRNNHVGGNKDNSLLEQEDLTSKEFEGPEGQEFSGFQGCVRTVEDWDGIDDPEAVCAQWHYDDTGEWPGEKLNETNKVYVGGADEAPDGAILERDEHGLFYRQQAYELVTDEYPEDIEDESEIDMPEADDADGPD